MNVKINRRLLKLYYIQYLLMDHREIFILYFCHKTNTCTCTPSLCLYILLYKRNGPAELEACLQEADAFNITSLQFQVSDATLRYPSDRLSMGSSFQTPV